MGDIWLVPHLGVQDVYIVAADSKIGGSYTVFNRTPGYWTSFVHKSLKLCEYSLSYSQDLLDCSFV